MKNSSSSDKMNDLHDHDKPPGIYVGLLVSPESKEKIYQFCKDTLSLDMTNSESPYEKRTHATLFSAQESKGHTLENFEQFIEQKEFLAQGVKWEIWTSPYTHKRCLILKIESREMIQFHNELRKKTGLEHAFPDYLPHVSIHYDYQGELPTALPNFSISLQEMYSKPYFFKNNKKDDLSSKDIQKQHTKAATKTLSPIEQIKLDRKLKDIISINVGKNVSRVIEQSVSPSVIAQTVISQISQSSINNTGNNIVNNTSNLSSLSSINKRLTNAQKIIHSLEHSENNVTKNHINNDPLTTVNQIINKLRSECVGSGQKKKTSTK